MLKQRLDFSMENKLKLWIDYLKPKAKKLLKQRLDFPFEEKIGAMDSLAKMHGKKKC